MTPPIQNRSGLFHQSLFDKSGLDSSPKVEELIYCVPILEVLRDPFPDFDEFASKKKAVHWEILEEEVLINRLPCCHK